MAPTLGSTREHREATRELAMVHRFRLAGPRTRGRSAAAAMAGVRRDPSRSNRGLRVTIAPSESTERKRGANGGAVLSLGSGVGF